MLEHLRRGRCGVRRRLLWRGFLGAALVVAMFGGLSCGPSLEVSVRYGGGKFLRPTLPQSIVVLRTNRPDRPYEDMGTVSVTCPSSATVAFGSIEQEGGCDYNEAVNRARIKLAEMGADGMYGITSAAAANGAIVSLVATAFYYQAPGRAPSDKPASPSAPSAEERLRQLQNLREKALITPEDYEKRKAEILKQI